MNDWRREEALNETRSRSANEGVETYNDAPGAANGTDRYQCECSDAGCEELISLTRAEYEAVRSDGLHFAITTNHENPELDRLVVEHERFSIVAKLPGEPARIALDSDPRTH